VFARLTTTVIGINEREAAAEIVDGILPTLRSLDGFKGVLVLADEKTRVIHGMTLWESAEAMERSESVMRLIREAETNSRDVVSQESNTFRVAAFHLNQP
jgi:heme-degrading monooxygenase HmoA